VEYRPHPRGLLEAREALAAALSAPGDPVDPEDLILTASTSESYSFLWKLFADPGDEVLAFSPSYPLLDGLAALDGLSLRHVPLSPHPDRPGGRRFAIDPEAVREALSPRTRLLAVIHPGNPSGRYLSPEEQEELARLCAERGLPLVSDEVFAEYPLREDVDRAGPAAATASLGLSFSLGGLSKGLGLPGWKLGWLRAGGPPDLRRRALAALEHVADSYLSVATPVQRALPELLALAPRLQALLRERLRTNLATLRAALAGSPGIELLEPEGGWSAVLQVPGSLPDEDLTLELLERTGVLLHPGYFFDFASEDFLVLSLLPEPVIFAQGVCRLSEELTRLAGRHG
ncbi:MAG TPA: pyridoxal phosphate-dependent aminotransferase, partial [Thermoanaerobaculia bacterium]|nr:pyridoxal phosphate-dependent aminotransferase [Thermoanaerobaculia bacterium]